MMTNDKFMAVDFADDDRAAATFPHARAALLSRWTRRYGDAAYKESLIADGDGIITIEWRG